MKNNLAIEIKPFASVFEKQVIDLIVATQLLIIIKETGTLAATYYGVMF